MRIVVVGGGIAGLATAFFLRRSVPPDLGVEVAVMESEPVPGGRVRSLHEDGFVLEWGPHGVLDNAPTTNFLIEALGLEGRRLSAAAAARRRFVLHRGRLVELPDSPFGLLATPLLAPAARLRLLREPFVRRGSRHEESIAQFFTRRLGAGVLPALVEPFVTGVFAGDPARLSLPSCFPALARLERESGSLTRGILARIWRRRRGAQPGPRPGLPRLTSFPGGLGELSDALAAALGGALRLATRAAAVRRRGARFVLDLVSDAGTETLDADALVLATPAAAARRICAEFDPDLASTFDMLPHAGVAVVNLGFRREDVAAPLDGFGYLAARGEAHGPLGCIFASSVFPAHAPPGFVLLRCMFGGVRDPKALDLGDEALVEAARRDLDTLLGLRGRPSLARVFRHPGALPQYTLGHQARLAAIDSQLRAHPRLFVTGAAYRGVGVNDCIRNAAKVAGNVARMLLHPDG